jgi:hypothetical protein
MATLHTRVILSKNIKMDRDYKNVLDYTETNLLNLCRASGNLVAETTTAQFINPTGKIYVPFTYSQCLQSNYLAFQNPDYDNKWFFCFIDNVIFKSKNCQEISYTVDIWSTWFKKLTIKPSFVIREHVNDDTIGLHTIDEGLDVGEVYSTYETDAISSLTGGFWVALFSTHDPDLNADFSGVTMYNRNVYGGVLYLFDMDLTSVNRAQASIDNLTYFLSQTNSQKSGDLSCINSMFIIPQFLFSPTDVDKVVMETWPDGDDSYTYYKLKLSYNIDTLDFKLPIANSTPSGYYVPFNNKCYCYPYNYLYATNNSGVENIYKWEDFTYTVTEGGVKKVVFHIVGSVGQGYSCKAIPEGYKNISMNTSEAIPLGKFPVCRLELRRLYKLANSKFCK